MPIKELLPSGYNPRKITGEAKARLRKSIEELGTLQPLTWNQRTRRIVGGHQRLEVYAALGRSEVEVFVVDLDETKEKAANLALNNSSGEWDQDKLADLLKELTECGMDMELTGFDLDAIAESVGGTEQDDDTFMDTSDALPGAAALKMDMQFPSDAPFGIPELREDMLADVPDGLATWAGRDATEESDHYLYNVSTDSVRGLDFSKTIIGFYTDDKRFEQAWDAPDLFTAKLLNRKPLSVISPNFSLWFQSPAAVKIWNTYRSRWCGRYFQEAGLKVIPDVNFSGEESWEYCFAGVPKNAPCVSIQIQTGKKTTEEIEAKRRDIAKAIETLTPKALLLYVGDGYERMIEGLPLGGIRLVPVMNRIQKRRSLMNRKGGEKQ